MQTGKVTFSQAAKLLSLHPNTLKNWQKAGKLATAEKGKVNGVITWLVELEEVAAVSQQGYTIVDTGAAYQPTQTAQEPPEQAEQDQPDPPKQDTQTTQLQPNIEATLTIFRESVVAPLTALIEKQGNQIAELSVSNGRLEERVRNLEEQLHAAQAAQDAARLAESPPPPANTPRAENGSQTAQEPSPILHSDTLRPITTPTKKGFWSRLLGG